MYHHRVCRGALKSLARWLWDFLRNQVHLGETGCVSSWIYRYSSLILLDPGTRCTHEDQSKQHLRRVLDENNWKPHKRCGCPVGKSVGYCRICPKQFCFSWNVICTTVTLNSLKMPNHSKPETIKQLQFCGQKWKISNHKRDTAERVCILQIPSCNLPFGQKLSRQNRFPKPRKTKTSDFLPNAQSHEMGGTHQLSPGAGRQDLVLLVQLELYEANGEGNWYGLWGIAHGKTIFANALVSPKEFPQQSLLCWYWPERNKKKTFYIVAERQRLKTRFSFDGMWFAKGQKYQFLSWMCCLWFHKLVN